MTPLEFIAAELSLESIKPEEKLAELGMDSLEFLEFLLAIENKFNVPTTKSVDCVTVADLIRLIESH